MSHLSPQITSTDSPLSAVYGVHTTRTQGTPVLHYCGLQAISCHFPLDSSSLFDICTATQYPYTWILAHTWRLTVQTRKILNGKMNVYDCWQYMTYNVYLIVLWCTSYVNVFLRSSRKCHKLHIAIAPGMNLNVQWLHYTTN